jgi:hypothetical protein
MAEPTYFVISPGEGDPRIEPLTREELTRRLSEGYYGDVGFMGSLRNKNINEWGDNIMIIKGEVVIPRPVEVVKRYDV